LAGSSSAISIRGARPRPHHGRGKETIMTPSAASTAPGWLDRETYPFQSRWTEPAGLRVHYVDKSTGAAVLFVLHGTPTWSFEFRHVITALARRHCSIALDRLGFGLSDRPQGADYSPKAHAGRLTAFVEGLRLNRFTLVVHDFGGPIGCPSRSRRRHRTEYEILVKVAAVTPSGCPGGN
jgi:haloalkane dehalogenase